MERNRAENLFDYDVIDNSGRKIGSVENVLVDDATGEPEFIGVKTGWMFGRTHVVPATNAHVDATGHRIEVPFAEDDIRNAPDLPAEGNVQPDEEERIYRHYGIPRSTERSASGLPGAGADAASRGRPSEGRDEERMTLSEEELQVGKRQVAAEGARLRKVVRTEHVEKPVDLKREEIHVERTPAGERDRVPEDAFQEQEIHMTATREEPVVNKEAHVTGEVRAYKTEETERRDVGGEVRREEVERERASAKGQPGERETDR